jgi:hypothetical protein
MMSMGPPGSQRPATWYYYRYMIAWLGARSAGRGWCGGSVCGFLQFYRIEKQRKRNQNQKT